MSGKRQGAEQRLKNIACLWEKERDIVGMQNRTASLEDRLVVSYEVKHVTVLRTTQAWGYPR